MKIVIAGGTGFIGSELIPYLYARGDEVTVLTRKNKKSPFYWNPETNQIDSSLLEGSDVMINLAGENIFGRWSQLKKRKIVHSRLHSSYFLVNTIMKLNYPPKLYIGASAIGYYGNRGIEKLTEKSEPGNDFLAKLCEKWEEIPKQLSSKGVRVVTPRFGVVLGSHGGALPSMAGIFKMGFGGMLGDGSQIFSWIAIDDLLGALNHVIENTELQGPVNFVSPEPVSNRELTKLLGKVLHRPTFFAVPKFALSLLVGKGAADMLTSSEYVIPEKLLHSHYQFQIPHLEIALKKYLQLND